MNKPFNEKHCVEPFSGCWLWTAGVMSNGYGAHYEGSRQISAHRYSWKLHHGVIPPGLHILHKCDTQLCVNPNHLFVGTNADNVADARSKGRLLTGSKHPSSKLTEADVRVIRASKEPQTVLARRFNVCQQLISYIQRRLRWRSSY